MIERENDTPPSSETDVPPEVRERILSSALELFASRGYNATSLREVALAAGVTKPMVYYYFGSKEGLYRTLMEAANGEFEAILNRVKASEGSAREQMILLLREHLRVARSQRDIVRLWLAATLGPPGGVPHIEVNEAHKHRGEEVLLDIMMRGAERGELRQADPQVMALAVRGAITVFYAASLEESAMPVGDDLPERFVDILLRGLGNPRQE